MMDFLFERMNDYEDGNCNENFKSLNVLEDEESEGIDHVEVGGESRRGGGGGGGGGGEVEICHGV